jgi:hypothetical protein
LRRVQTLDRLLLSAPPNHSATRDIVNNCKISHVSAEVLDNIIAWLREEYENVFTDGSGKMKVTRGKVHKYLGMTLDFTVKYVVKVTMIEYVNEIIASWD